MPIFCWRTHPPPWTNVLSIRKSNIVVNILLCIYISLTFSCVGVLRTKMYLYRLSPFFSRQNYMNLTFTFWFEKCIHVWYWKSQMFLCCYKMKEILIESFEFFSTPIWIMSFFILFVSQYFWRPIFIAVTVKVNKFERGLVERFSNKTLLVRTLV